MGNNIYKWVISSLVIASVSFAGGYFTAKAGRSADSSPGIKSISQEVSKKDPESQTVGNTPKTAPLASNYFQFENARVVKNYQDDDNPKRITSLEFKATIINQTGSKKQIFTDFYIRDSSGIVLKTDRGWYEIDGNSGTREPRVLTTFSGPSDDYSGEDVASIELRYYSNEDDREVSIALPIHDQ